jgi:general secretion pathway protein F
VKTYQYRGYDVSGTSTRGFVEALSSKSARETLASRGVLADKLTVTGSKARFNVESRSIVFRELSALLKAGVPLTRALEILIASPDSAQYASVLAGVRDRVREGSTLARALREGSVSVSAYELAVIEAAEATAGLAELLENVADFLDDQVSSRERVRSALVYPIFVGVTGVLVATVMLVFLVPKAEMLLQTGNGEMPAITQFAMMLGRLSLRIGPALLGLLVAAIAIVTTQYRRNETFRVAFDRQRFRWPVVRKGTELLVNLRFCKTMAVLLQGGVSIEQAFPLAARASGNAWVAALAKLHAESLREGQPLSRVLADIPPLRERVPGWVAIGEESGELSPLLLAASKRLDDQWQRYVTRSLSLLEPVLILLIGAFVLFVTLAILLPVLSLSQSVG